MKKKEEYVLLVNQEILSKKDGSEVFRDTCVRIVLNCFETKEKLMKNSSNNSGMSMFFVSKLCESSRKHTS